MSATAPRILPRILPRLFFRPNLTRRPLAQRFFTTAPSGPPNPTLSARLKHLSKEYGYSALGVYLAISALDFPLCFLGVRMVGSERIGEYEDATVSHLRKWYGATRATIPALPVWKEKSDELLEEQREQREGVKASIWTELALAYAIHKSFIFVRVPLTAAVTPKVVKVLRGWGWDIGKKGGAAKVAAKVAAAVKKGPGVPK